MSKPTIMVTNQMPSNIMILFCFFTLFLNPFGVLALLAEAETGAGALILASNLDDCVSVAVRALDRPPVLLRDF